MKTGKNLCELGFNKDFLKVFIYLFIYLFIFRERGKRGRETSKCGCFSRAPYWALGPHPGVCPDWESKRQPFGAQIGTQFTEPHQPCLSKDFLGVIPKSIQENIDKLDFIKINKFCFVKHTVKKRKSQDTNWGKFLANHLSEKYF